MAWDPATDRRRKVRREADGDMGLDRNDLYLLRESYRNTIELSTSVLERQEVLNTSIERILAELVKICANQVSISADIGKLPAELRDLIDNLCRSTAVRCDDLKQTIDKHRREDAREHGAHSLRIYGAFGVLGALAIALIGLLVKIWPTLTIAAHVGIPGP